MKKNVKGAFMLLMLLCSGLIAQGQSSSKSCCAEKAGCSPSACGPHNTKVEESEAVVRLRADLQKQLNLLASSSLEINQSFKNFELPKGKNEDESLLIIMQMLYALKIEIAQNAAADKILPGFEVKPEVLPRSKREMMVFLIKETDLLGKQIQFLL